jgi:hypothetical protein
MTGLRVGLDAIVNTTVSVMLSVLMTQRPPVMQTRTSEEN